MAPGRGQRGAHGRGIDGIHDGVMNEDEVEFASEIQRPHFPKDMVTFGIHRAAHLEHPWRPIGQRKLQVFLEMIRKASSACSKLKESTQRRIRARK